MAWPNATTKRHRTIFGVGRFMRNLTASPTTPPFETSVDPRTRVEAEGLAGAGSRLGAALPVLECSRVVTDEEDR